MRNFPIFPSLCVCVLSVGLFGCGHDQAEKQIELVPKPMPYRVPCGVDYGKEPDYPDTDIKLRGTFPHTDQAIGALYVGRGMRDDRIKKLKGDIDFCNRPADPEPVVITPSVIPEKTS
jgi:hypothetical protein